MTEGNKTDSLIIGNNTANVWRAGSVPGIQFGSNTAAFHSPSLTVQGDGWAIFGKPSLRALLRYWWRSGRRLK